MKHPFATHILLLTLLTAIASLAYAADAATSQQMVERGRYLVTVSGCNDCHTPNYPESGGKIPESDRLTGNSVGFQGPWGTSYPSNLRLTMKNLNEQQWLQRARQPLRPPMPWFSLRDMTDDDLRAVYAYIRQLGPKGQPAPAYAAPGQTVSTPYIEFMPKNLPRRQASAE